MSTHIIHLSIVYRMEDMTGTAEQSAEIAYEQVTEAIAGRQSEYGWPEAEYCDVAVEGYFGNDGEDAEHSRRLAEDAA